MDNGVLPRPVALQLYTFRNLPISYPEVLALTAEIGFAGVEGSGLQGLSSTEYRQIVDDLGLEVCSAHVPLPDGDEGKTRLEEVHGLGATALFSSLHPDDFASADAVARAADRFAEASAVAQDAGYELGYHNHEWEFAQRVGDRPAYEAFLDAISQRGVPVHVEVDLYWAHVGGADPAQLVGGLGEAVHYLHVKDGPGACGVPMTALGQGVVNLPAALSANAAIRWHIIEIDDTAADMVLAVRASYRYLVDGRFSYGRLPADQR